MKICIQTGDVIDRIGAKKGYALFKKTGFESIDWNLDKALKIAPKNYDEFMQNKEYIGTCIFEKSLDAVIKHYADELAIIKENGLKINQAHAPFPAYRVGYPEFFDYYIEIIKRNIEYCDYIGCKYLVVHGISTIPNREDMDCKTVTELNYKLYRSLIPTLKNCKTTKVCLENLFGWCYGHATEGVCSNPYEAVEIIDTLNCEAGKEAFCLCLDTGHLNLLNKDFNTYITTLGSRIKCLHIHDNDARADLHLAPFTGNIDWKGFCTALKSIGFDDDISFETFAQTNRAEAFNEELIEPWLNLICKIGESFKKQILED